MPASSSITVVLPDPVDLFRFRSEARALLQQGIPPGQVHWHVATESEDDLFAQQGTEPQPDAPLAAPPAEAPEAPQPDLDLEPATADGNRAPIHTELAAPAPAEQQSSPARKTTAPRVPAFFLDLCRRVILHSDPGRFELLYRLLWRLLHEPGLRHDPLDPDRIQADQMARAVRRDMHKMTAFVRFRTVHPPIEQAHADAPANRAITDAADSAKRSAGLLHIAWFEPEHHIVAAIAPFFVRRFTGMHWAILTPQASIEWIPVSDAAAAAAENSVPPHSDHADDITPPAAKRRGRLLLGPAARREDAPPADAGEALWLTYYTHIFNPARLKLRMMQKEMPRRYWHNLPEAQLISGLSASAHRRSQQMVERGPSTPRRRLPAAAPVGRESGDTASPSRPTSAAADTHRHATGHGHGSGSGSGSLHTALSSGWPSPATVLRTGDLKAATDRCRACPIGEHATQSVAGAGPATAQLMVVGEQPGDQEDLRGLPFVGPAGRLFDRALQELGWDRQTLYITNAVKHFKFELRGQRRIHKTPTQQEVAACLQWLEREITLVQPAAVLALGATAARAVLGRPVAVMKERGQWHASPHGVPVLVTLHPSALLRADPAHSADDFARWLEDLSKAFSPPR